jgi:hypothetical protein
MAAGAAGVVRAGSPALGTEHVTVGLDCHAVAGFIFWMPRVAGDMAESNLVEAGEAVELSPEVFVFDGDESATFLPFPALLLPFGQLSFPVDGCLRM